MLDTDAIIIGAGVVGLAVAKYLSQIYKNVYIIEKNKSFGMEISSRNSEVIHSGIYYPPDSLKSKLCIKGKKYLYEYCKLNSIPFNKIGKLVIGHNKQDYLELKKIKLNAEKCGVRSSFIVKEDLKRMEPNLRAEYALHFRESGIIDSHAYMKSLVNEVSENDVEIAYCNEVVNIKKTNHYYTVTIKGPDATLYEVTSSIVINCAGLYANYLSSLSGVKNKDYIISYWKGEYFWISDKSNVKVDSLIYPVPNKYMTGLGIHTTISLSGRMRLGPNALYLGEKLNFDYSVDSDNKVIFYKAAKKYLPNLKIDNIHPDQSGVRPKLQKPNEGFKDFIIKNEKDVGYNNFINLIGIESPGLTASLAIGDYVCKLIN